jgi:hypothetical protein
MPTQMRGCCSCWIGSVVMMSWNAHAASSSVVDQFCNIMLRRVLKKLI